MVDSDSPRATSRDSAEARRSPPWDDFDVDALHEVTDPARVAILTDPNRVRFLVPFLGRDATVSQVAAELEVSPNALLYRVRRMVDAGLLQVTATRPRAGRAVKVYRASHDGYRVPMSAMRYDDIRHRVDTYGRPLLENLARAYTAALLTAPRHDRVIARTRAGDVWATDLLPSATRQGDPLLFADTVLWLDQEQANRVQRRMQEALEDALSAADPMHASDSTTPYFVMGALLPMPPASG